VSSIYRSCSPRRVASPVLVARTLDARVVYLHLLVGELAGQVPGIIRAGAGAIAEDVGFDVDRTREALAELETAGLIELDTAARLVRLPGVAEDAARLASTPNVVIGWARVLAELPECGLRARHAAALMALVRPEQRSLFEPFAKGSDTLSEPFGMDENNPSERRDTRRSKQDSSRIQIAIGQEQEQQTHAGAGEPLALTPDAPTQKSPRARRPDPAASPDVLAVWAVFQRMRVDLGMLDAARTLDESGRPRQPAGDEQARDLARGLKRARGATNLITVLRRQAESVRRQGEREGAPPATTKGAEFYRTSTLCSASRIADMLDEAAEGLDHRRPAIRGSRAPAGRPSRPPPPQNPGSLPADVPTDFGTGEKT
jgi:hypothetical protein